MTALTLVMGFYEFVRKGQKYDGKSDASTSLGGRLIKAHDKHAPCAVVGLRHPSSSSSLGDDSFGKDHCLSTYSQA
jgi:hypothetical protein